LVAKELEWMAIQFLKNSTDGTCVIRGGGKEKGGYAVGTPSHTSASGHHVNKSMS
jgi:hypothetical protein